MNRAFWTSTALAALACLCFWLLVKQATTPWIRLATHHEVSETLAESMVAFRRLSETEPQSQQWARLNYEKTRGLLAHLEVLQLKRQSMATQFNALLLLLFVLAGSGFWLYHILRARGTQRGLARLSQQLLALARGQPLPELPPLPSSIFAGEGPIWQALEGLVRDSHALAADDRQRLRSLEALQTWQDSARAMAHEIRTPLTAMGQILNRLQGQCGETPLAPELVRKKVEALREEVQGLHDFASAITGFARVRSPQRTRQDLNAVLGEFLELHSGVWPGLTLQCQAAEEPLPLFLDRGMVRQVLVNLINNSALACGVAGRVTLNFRKETTRIGLVVQDDGPGIPQAMQKRLFEPYATSRPFSQGMGLGLAISRKIMLEHQGDLQWLPSETGATFVLWFPKEQP